MTNRSQDPVAGTLTLDPASDLESHDGPARRRTTGWDALGVLALVAVMLTVERAAVAAVGPPLGRAHAMALLTRACWALLATGLAVLVVRDHPRAADVPRRLTAVWREPPGGWVAFALGAILAVPVLALYTPDIFFDADSARIVAALHYVQSGGLRYFTTTQEPYLPHLVLGPPTALWGLAGARLAALVTVQVLVGVVSYITYRITGQLVAAAAAAAALLAISPVYDRAVSLPLYPTALALGYLGGWLGYRAMREPDGVAWRLVVPAGVCLALAPEAQGTGQLFLAVPALLVVLAPSLRRGVGTAVRLYAVILACSIPRAVINLSDGGLSYATSPRADYWVTRGYLGELQRNFWVYTGISETVPSFLARLPGRFMGFLGGPAWVVVVLAAVGWAAAGRARARWFVVAAAGFLFLAVTVKRIPPFPRYYAQFWPGLAILAGVGVARLVRVRAAPARLALVVSVLGLAAAAGVAYRGGLERTEAAQRGVDVLPLRAYAAAIDDGKGVIGARAHQALLSVDADIPTWGDQFLTEQEYVTYLTWPSDAAVIALMRRHDIGWVFLDRRRRLEGIYNNTWLVPHYGLPARYAQRVEASPNFCRRMGNPRDFELFKLGPCRGGQPTNRLPTAT